MPWNTKELTIGELAERSGVPASALRFYERQGLIRSRRTSGNQRRYHRTTLRVVAFIRASQNVGIPLAVIGEVLGFLPEGATPTREFWVRASDCWREELNARIERLERMRDLFTECIGCGCLSFEQCTLVNPGDKLGEKGSGPHRLSSGPRVERVEAEQVSGG
ncbi:MerR family transcriptional regulator [Acrocarpospora pleiomorpha]|uniref:MerR family transcriptional regulator n=1 Tax=Acrocarpospora pleiomorpha TaxID=90975 RepID=A0A5M3XE34_9ACTN|nr:redox-sensitive transcriptional activator SoxR [Acrocarpospora pleiomorpha]GES18429.1 MerR family transcriptional regulator [Acrocarpospora pleiomorpha]